LAPVEAVQGGGGGVVSGEIDDHVLALGVEGLVGQPQLPHLGMDETFDAGAVGQNRRCLQPFGERGTGHDGQFVDEVNEVRVVAGRLGFERGDLLVGDAVPIGI
jgi:hypothetical protein